MVNSYEVPVVSVNRLLESWGMATKAPESLRAHAALCVRYADIRVGEIAVGLGLATQEAVEAAMSQCPANVLALEHLSNSVPGLREQNLRILAISRGLPYLDSIADKLKESAAALEGTAKARLDELNAAYLETPSGQPMVVFADLANLLQFAQAGRMHRLADPLRLALLGREPVLALAPPLVVARNSRNEGGVEGMHVLSSAAQDNFWSPSLARTDAERILGRLLDEAMNRGATDVEIAPKRDGTAAVRFRVFGDMVEVERHGMLSPETAREIVNFLISRSRAGDGGRLRRPADGQLTYKSASSEVFIRCSFIPADRYGLEFDMISVSLRLLPRTSSTITLSSLNLAHPVPAEIAKALMRSQGLIVLAGPTNSGKSTTIAGVVGEHVRMFGASRKRLSLEEPVERYLDGITQISVDGNFAEVVRALLRHDPDLVWIGEIRDAFSAAACVRAATSGHLVLSTVHANNSILAFRAIANYLRKDTGEVTGAGATVFDLAESLSLIVSQRLVKRLCPQCRRKRRVTQEELSLLGAYLEAEGQGDLAERAVAACHKGVYEPTGCKQCSNIGFIGELPVNEVLPTTREVRELFSRSSEGLDYAPLAAKRLNTLTESVIALLESGETVLASLFI